MNIEGTIGFVLGSLLFALVQLLQLDIEEWKERKRDRDNNEL